LVEGFRSSTVRRRRHYGRPPLDRKYGDKGEQHERPLTIIAVVIVNAIAPEAKTTDAVVFVRAQKESASVVGELSEEQRADRSQERWEDRRLVNQAGPDLHRRRFGGHGRPRRLHGFA